MALRFIAVLTATVCCLRLIGASILPPQYDVVWTSPAPPVNGSSSSMPLGGHDLGLNVWAENSTLLFYIGKAGCYDENNSLLKLGRVRLTLDPNPFAPGQPFEQRLLLEDGYVRFTGGNGTVVNLWVDMFNPVVHVEIESPSAVHLTASYETWRTRNRVMVPLEQGQSSWNGVTGDNATTLKDEVHFWHDNSVLSYHRNIDSRVFDATLAQQRLTGYRDELYDPLTDNTFGMMMYGEGLNPGTTSQGVYANTTFKSWNLQSQQPERSFKLTIATHQDQSPSLEQWESDLLSLSRTATHHPQDKTITWWKSFWDRSHIFVNTDFGTADPSFQVGRNYQLFRYMLGCNAFARWPSKFNGALFTFDPGFVSSDYDFTPDFRLWGGGTFTAQNQRLVYWPLLKSGDLDLMVPQFDFYRRIVNTSTLRGRVYHNIDHSWLTEQIDNSGLPQIFNFNSDEYIFHTKRPTSFNPGLEFDAWIIWLSDTAVRFSTLQTSPISH